MKMFAQSNRELSAPAYSCCRSLTSLALDWISTADYENFVEEIDPGDNSG